MVVAAGMHLMKHKSTMESGKKTFSTVMVLGALKLGKAILESGAMVCGMAEVNCR